MKQSSLSKHGTTRKNAAVDVTLHTIVELSARQKYCLNSIPYGRADFRLGQKFELLVGKRRRLAEEQLTRRKTQLIIYEKAVVPNTQILFNHFS